MAKPHASAMNAVKHGVFQQVDLPTARSAFASLAERVAPGPLGSALAADVIRAETRTARCRAGILRHTQAIESLCSDAHFSTGYPATQIDEALCELTRLLRYQNDSLTSLRKGWIAILNAAEGLDPLRKILRG